MKDDKTISLPVWNKLGVEFETSVFSPQRKIFKSSTDKYGSWKVQQLLKQISFHKVFLLFVNLTSFKSFYFDIMYYIIFYKLYVKSYLFKIQTKTSLI